MTYKWVALRQVPSLPQHSLTVMSGPAAATFAVIALLFGVAVAGPIVGTADQLSHTFRQSVAQAVRDNVARQQLSVAAASASAAPVAAANSPINFPLGRSRPAAPALPILPVLPVLPAVSAVPVVAPAPLTPPAIAVAAPTDADTYSNEIAVDFPAEATADAADDNAKEQAKNAHYSFDTSVMDTINGHSHTRQETRWVIALCGLGLVCDDD